MDKRGGGVGFGARLVTAASYRKQTSDPVAIQGTQGRRRESPGRYVRTRSLVGCYDGIAIVTGVEHIGQGKLSEHMILARIVDVKLSSCIYNQLVQSKILAKSMYFTVF